MYYSIYSTSLCHSLGPSLRLQPRLQPPTQPASEPHQPPYESVLYLLLSVLIFKNTVQVVNTVYSAHKYHSCLYNFRFNPISRSYFTNF